MKTKHWFYAPGTTSRRGSWIEIEVDEAEYPPGAWAKYDSVAAPYASMNKPMLVFPPEKLPKEMKMSLCPAFYCSRCKFAHADECITANPCAEVTRDLQLKVGTKLRHQTRKEGEKDWEDSGLTYEVVQLVPELRVRSLRNVGYGPGTFTAQPELWNEAGFHNVTAKRFYRFLPVAT